MHTLRLALAQLNTTVGDLEGNRERILEAAHRAAEHGADVVAFPELAVTGYPPEDLLLRSAFIHDAWRSLERLVEEAQGLPPLIVGCIDFDQHLYNAAVVAHGGRILGTYRKQRLPNYGVFDEERYFHPGHESLVFTIGNVPVGVTICEDAWYPGGPVSDQAIGGAQIVVNINASPFQAGKTRFRERMMATRASDNTVAIAYVNQVGGQDELVFDGNSLVFDAEGAVIARGAAMEEDLLLVDVSAEAVLQRQLHDTRLRRMRETVGLEERVRTVHVTGEPFRIERPPLPGRQVEPLEALAETYQALVVGTRDYVRKVGFEQVFVALSGGIDSALVGAVAVDALGPERVTGVSMPSRYSSEGSIKDAVDLAERLGIRLASLPIEPVHQAALDVLETEFGGDAGLAGENVQSRIRGMLVMALSNHAPRSLVVTTGNKSEYACGYATLYGDMVGGFAVIKDVPKSLVWDLARYRNTLGPGAGGEVIPESSISKLPSAELRPGQLDTDSLPPYDVLDPILEAYVEEDLSLEAIVERGFEEETVRRVIDLVNRNEYKRRQAPPGVKITPRAFGRDRRLPLASRYRGY